MVLEYINIHIIDVYMCEHAYVYKKSLHMRVEWKMLELMLYSTHAHGFLAFWLRTSAVLMLKILK